MDAVPALARNPAQCGVERRDRSGDLLSREENATVRQLQARLESQGCQPHGCTRLEWDLGDTERSDGGDCGLQPARAGWADQGFGQRERTSCELVVNGVNQQRMRPAVVPVIGVEMGNQDTRV